MALTKAREAITQVTATGQSTTLDIAASYRTSIYIEHNNGTGTITAGAQIIIQVKPDGGTVWYDFITLEADTTASSENQWVIMLPDDAGDVRIDYTAPTGSTGHTLDAEVGKITGV